MTDDPTTWAAPTYDGRTSPLCAQGCVNDRPEECGGGCFEGWNEQQTEAEDAAAGHAYEQCPSPDCEPHRGRWLADDPQWSEP